MHINNLGLQWHLSPCSSFHAQNLNPPLTQMSKRFKLRLSIPSFQLCRSKKPFSFPKPASPAPTYLFSPINPKAFEIAYPNLPDPPPTTPTSNNHRTHNPLSKGHLSSKISPLNSFSDSPPNPHKHCNSPTSFDFSDLPTSPPSKQKKKLSVTPVDSAWDLSSEETESLFSSSTSFDDASSFDFSNCSANNKGGVKKTSKNIKARKLKRYASNKCTLGMSDSTEPENYINCNNKSSGKKMPSSVFRKLTAPCGVEGKVKESYAVVTRSDDPYEDFKRSMLEMILEKQIFEAKELEELLHCFLSLNSPHHHAVIVAAFTEIWEVLFL